jgi:phosphonate transport system substrate-binding protein
MIRRTLMLAALGATMLAGAAVAQDWKSMVPVIRVGILGGENEADRLKNYACWKDHLTKRFGVPVELYPAADYAGVMQGLIADQLEVAGLGPSGYAGIVVQDPEAVEVVGVQQQTDGGLGYFSVLVVRADSGIRSIEDMKGKSLAFADPNSTSGYLVPAFELREKGYDPATHFGRTGFAGGHEQAIIALLNKQYDGAVTWISGQGEESKGFTSGNLRKMVDKGALDMKDIRIVWRSTVIPNGPDVIRKELPAAFKAAYKELLMGLPKTDPECFNKIQGGDFAGLAEMPPGFYDLIIKMRQDAAKARRG